MLMVIAWFTLATETEEQNVLIISIYGFAPVREDEGAKI